MIITNRGQPVAALIPIRPEALEDFLLATADEYVDSMREADEDHATGKTVPMDEVFAGLDATEEADA